MQDLTKLTNQELEEFFNSFDIILSDIDGVLRNVLQPISGSVNAVKFLQKMGKRFVLVTNNTSKSIETTYQELKVAGFEIEKSEIVSPIAPIVAYLQKQNLVNKKVFVIGMGVLKQAIKDAGFILAPYGPDRIKDSTEMFYSLAIEDDTTVEAVICDVDFNLNYLNLQKAETFLKRPEVIFIGGAPDVKFPVGTGGRILLGPGIFLRILEGMSKRTSIHMSKPSPFLNDYIMEKYGIKDRSRALFIGDVIPVDMAFAGNCGYRKLLVLSGLESKSSLENWGYEEKWKPEFYVDSLKEMHEMALRVFGK
ncbi:uncharacterized protein LOC135140814 [Zophobas morio]|uniref:uncharacterized protein LOC135140814 n=1 Tax=Zophobas morio TaxID=2755281 RepID=UPI00308370AB